MNKIKIQILSFQLRAIIKSNGTNSRDHSGSWYTNSALLYNPPPLFDLKIGYSYVIEVADSEY